MSRDITLYLSDILEACKKVRLYTAKMSRAEFEQNSMTYDAVVRNLEIVGEAAKHTPVEIRDGLTAVEWRKIAGLRDILAHAYFGIDDDIIWSVITNKIPHLRASLEQYLSSLPVEGSND